MSQRGSMYDPVSNITSKNNKSTPKIASAGSLKQVGLGQKKRETPISDGKPAAETNNQMIRMKFFRAASLARTLAKFTKRDNDSSSNAASTAPQMENTYQLEPNEKGKFKSNDVEKEILTIIKDNLKNFEYNGEKAKKYSTALTSMITDKVKQMGYNRYKLVSNVMIGEDCGQSVGYTSQCIWDTKLDSCASVTYMGTGFYVVALVHAVYFE